jgi:GWxTD domain-containing protein
MNIRKVALSGLVCFSLSACGLIMLPSKDDWYAKHYFIMQKFEQEAYKSLTANARIEFQKLFWESRSPMAKQEFDKRIAYITDNFKKENFKQPWNTDRARIFLLNGPPAAVDFKPNDAWGTQVVPGGRGGTVSADDRTGEDIQASTLEVWTYPYGTQIVYYSFMFQPPSKWTPVQISTAASRFIGELELKSKFETWSVLDEAAYRKKIDELKTIK